MKEKSPKNSLENEKRKETLEKGKKVRIILKFIRHGERTKEGLLTNLGRRITKERAQKKGREYENFNAVKAVGSSAGPKGSSGMERSLETPHLQAKEIPSDKEFQTRAQNLLSYETLKTPPPFDWEKYYNSHLPEDFKSLPDEEIIKAAKKAQEATFNHLISLNTPEAERFKKEIVGAFAVFIDHYIGVTRRLKSESKVLIPAGTHGGIMEHILQQALVRQDEEGKEIIGFEDIGEIGGEFSPSDSYNVFVETDAEGKLKKLKVTFDNPERPSEDMFLDPDILKELKEFYLALHKDDKTMGG